MDKTTYFYPNKTLRLGDNLLDLSTPAVMGILNTTPDSFFDGGKYATVENALVQAEKMIGEGAAILDVGGMSTRPGADIVDQETELNRVIPVIAAIKNKFPETPVSIDTVYGKVAAEAIRHGATMINDVSAGAIDPSILFTAAKFHVPYILMHMKGVPLTMQTQPHYDDVTAEITGFFIDKCTELHQQGIHDIILDPGFGFGKSLEHNYALVQHFELLTRIGPPVLAGVSRKSMLCKLLKVNPEKALNGTTALHAVLLLKGASILRVHDVKEAVETMKIIHAINT